MVSRVFSSRGGAPGFSEDALRWRASRGDLQRVAHAAYVVGREQATALEIALAVAEAANGIVSGIVAGTLLGYDVPPIVGPSFIVPPSASGRRPGARRFALDINRVIALDGIPLTDGLQTLLDLAAELDDSQWEHALESALRQDHTSIDEIEAALPAMSKARTKGLRRIRRVLALRPLGAAPTESLLETLMVQLAREVTAPVPIRQLVVYDEYGEFVARVDLAWPELGVFLELDGQQHKGQPVYDANRETRVVAATGWLCGRFSWDEVRRNPVVSGRRLLRVLEQARRRPLSRADIGVN